MKSIEDILVCIHDEPDHDEHTKLGRIVREVDGHLVPFGHYTAKERVRIGKAFRDKNLGTQLSDRIADMIQLAARHRLPAIYPNSLFVSAGGLISYGPDTINQYRLAAGYVDRILKGKKPADLPPQAPTKYELAINLKTAKALGLTIPETLLATADEVIQNAGRPSQGSAARRLGRSWRARSSPTDIRRHPFLASFLISSSDTKVTLFCCRLKSCLQMTLR
jgi:hypothetical protein